MSSAAPDGSPVGLYARLPLAGEADLIHDAVGPAPCAILELGCGTGRILRALAAHGHDVTGVDESAEMLAHVTGARTVQARIEDLALDRTFDVVLLASYLVNTADDAQRAALLAAAGRHTRRPDGMTIIQWHPPGWFDTVRDGRSSRDGVEYTLRDVARDGSLLHATVGYRIGDDRWTHRFTARRLTEADLDAALAAAGLRRDRWLDPDSRWFSAVPR